MAQKNESSPLTPPPLSWNQTRRLPISPSRRPLLRRRSGTDPPSLPPRLSSSGGDQPLQLSHLASGGSPLSARIAQIDEVDAFDHAAIGDIEAGNHADADGHDASAMLIAAPRSSRPS